MYFYEKNGAVMINKTNIVILISSVISIFATTKAIMSVYLISTTKTLITESFCPYTSAWIYLSIALFFWAVSVAVFFNRNNP